MLVLACAEIQPPPGGPEDRTGPDLLQTIPAGGATRVAPGNRIELRFSERIRKPAAGEPVFISPRPANEPDIDWTSDGIVITLADSFAPDQTYLVTISSLVADQRGNKLDSTITLAFSTGDSIAGGRIGGHVYEGNRGAGGVIVALYDTSTAARGEAPYDSLYPEYRAVTNQQGYFSLNYLPTDAFDLLAFADRNNDGRFNPERERFAVSDRPADLRGKLPLSDLHLTMTALDTATPEIISVTLSPDNLLRIRLSKEIPARILAQPISIMLADSSGSSVAKSEAVLESHQERLRELTVAMDSLAPGTFALSLGLAGDRPPLAYQHVSIQPTKDKTPPSITSFEPSEKAHFASEVKPGIVFSEPIDASGVTEESVRLWRDETELVPVTIAWLDAFHLSLTPAQIEPGAQYEFRLTEFDFVDKVGNALGDSLTVYRFSTHDVDSLGSISGTITVNLPMADSVPAVLKLTRLGASDVFNLPAAGRTFSLDVPAGSYLLDGFLDLDGDGQRGLGSIKPLRPAEPYGALTDTVKVRARFETAGVELTFQ